MARKAIPRRRDDQDDDYDDRPRKKLKSPSKPNRLILFIGLGVGGVFLLLIGIVVTIILVVRSRSAPVVADAKPAAADVKPAGGGRKDAKDEKDVGVAPTIHITSSDLDKLRSNMTKADAIRALGEARTITAEEAKAAFLDASDHSGEITWSTMTKRTDTWIQWGSKAGAIYAGFGSSRSKKLEPRLMSTFFTVRQDDRNECVIGWINGGATIDRKDQAAEKLLAFERDPKWQKGMVNQDQLIGVWRSNSARLEFLADGDMKSQQAALTGVRGATAYRLMQDGAIEIDSPDPMRRNETRTTAYRLFISDDELMLYQLNVPQPVWEGPFFRER